MYTTNGYIKVNLPLNLKDFVNGNGEGVWVAVNEYIESLEGADFYGGEFYGTLANNSLYYPTLKCGDIIKFTMRGNYRSVCLYNDFLDKLEVISEEERIMLVKRIMAAHARKRINIRTRKIVSANWHGKCN